MKEPFSHFQLQFRVRERAIKKGFLWDREYPDKTVYSEDIEVRVGDLDEQLGTDIQFRWLSEQADWISAEKSEDGFRISLREAGAVSGNFLIASSAWPDDGCQDFSPASLSDAQRLKILKKVKLAKPPKSPKKG